MRQLAEGVASPADAEEIRRYAEWLEANPDAAETPDLAKALDAKDARATHD